MSGELLCAFLCVPAHGTFGVFGECGVTARSDAIVFVREPTNGIEIADKIIGDATHWPCPLGRRA